MTTMRRRPWSISRKSSRDKTMARPKAGVREQTVSVCVMNNREVDQLFPVEDTSMSLLH